MAPIEGVVLDSVFSPITRITAVRKLAVEAADNGMLAPGLRPTLRNGARYGLRDSGSAGDRIR